MGQKRKKTGDIFEISLMPYFNLYAYAKYIDITKYLPEARFPDILRVYNFFSKERLQSIEPIHERGLLFNPMYISGGNGLVNLVKFIINEPISPEDLIFPPIRVLITNNLSISAGDENGGNIGEDDRWNIVSPDYKQINNDSLSYDEVSTFDYTGLFININYIAFRIAVEIYKVSSINIPEKFELDWYQKDIFKMAIKMPTMVKKLNYCE